MSRTQEIDRRNIIELYRSGIGSNAVAEKTGFCQDTVLRTLRKHGEKVKSPNLPPTNETRRRMIEDYKAGASMGALVTKYHSGQKMVMKILKEAKVNRSRSEARQMYVADWSFFSKIDTSQKAYVLGFLWADGHNCISNNTVVTRLQAGDRSILEKIKTCLQATHPVRDFSYLSKGKVRPYVIFSVVSRQISQDLLRLGMVPRKTYDSKWPSIPLELERHFIRGYFDGDGCWYINYRSRHFGGEVNFTSNKQFLVVMAEKIRIHTGLIFRPYNKQSLVCGGIAKGGKNDMISFGQWIYKDAEGLYLERKYRKYLETIADER